MVMELAMTKLANYDSSWDKGNERLWDKKYRQWEKRDWIDWLGFDSYFPL